jgi:hypothetical protein
MKKPDVSLNGKIVKRIIIGEIVGFFLVIATAWITALFDPPYFFFHQVFTSIDIFETSFETVIIIILAVFVILFTNRLVRQIKYLEGFMVICASCKKIKTGDEWVQIEKIISESSNVMFSHGICPACAEKLYGDVIK